MEPNIKQNVERYLEQMEPMVHNLATPLRDLASKALRATVEITTELLRRTRLAHSLPPERSEESYAAAGEVSITQLHQGVTQVFHRLLYRSSRNEPNYKQQLWLAIYNYSKALDRDLEYIEHPIRKDLFCLKSFISVYADDNGAGVDRDEVLDCIFDVAEEIEYEKDQAVQHMDNYGALNPREYDDNILDILDRNVEKVNEKLELIATLLKGITTELRADPLQHSSTFERRGALLNEAVVALEMFYSLTSTYCEIALTEEGGVIIEIEMT